MKRLILAIIALLPIGAMTYVSCEKAVYAVFAAASLNPLSIHQYPSTSEVTRLRRDLQSHFRKYGVYIPVGDIIVANSEDLGQSVLSSRMVESCGQAPVYLWLPIQVELPIHGKKIWEYCFKPKVRLQAGDVHE